MFEAPIPGQSLTDEPRNYPWERPPEMTHPDDAIMYHIERVSKPETLDNVLYTLEFGMPTRHLAEVMCTSAVSQGIHSVDVSLIITPIIQEYLNATAKQAGIPFKQDFDNKQEAEADIKNKALMLFKKSIKENKDKDEGSQYLESLTDTPKEEPVEEPMEAPMEEEKPQGLMARL